MVLGEKRIHEDRLRAVLPWPQAFSSVSSFDLTRLQVQDPLGLLFVLGTILLGHRHRGGRALMGRLLVVAAPLRMIIGTLAPWLLWASMDTSVR